MTTLTRDLRRTLENTVRQARRTAEAGARKVIEQLGVGASKAPPLTQAQVKLRNALRAHGRQLGDRRDGQSGVQAVDRLVVEIAYEHWHRLLFARYLAELELLALPGELPMPIEDWKQHALETGADWIELASSSAQTMLPQIFRSDDPVLALALPPETRSALEDLMKGLPRDVFHADDSLGWVYQYWQADRKEEVNRSEKKIGADELPAVTQLFTEDYMVLFLLHNTLGAWWAGKALAANPNLADSASNEDELRAACAIGDVDWAYLRFVREDGKSWRPAAGTFDGWPTAATDITLLDPCMGSGHFLVFALPMLAAMRAAEEGLSAEDAIEAVLRDNLFGLEVDPRCTQIAAFNLALAAWRRIGYRQLPSLHLACSGLSLGVSKAEWLKLAERTAQALPVPPTTDLLGTEDNLFSDAMKRGFERLYDLFARAPSLGSLINPRAAGGDLIERGFDDLELLLGQVMAKAETAELAEMAVTAHGLAKAAEVLGGRFTLVATNVPYLGRRKQDQVLKEHCERQYPDAKADLATCFVERCLAYCQLGGSVALVAPQAWWFAVSYTSLRRSILVESKLNLIATLGEEAWQSFGDRGPVAALFIADLLKPDDHHRMGALDGLSRRSIEQKQNELASGKVRQIFQSDQLSNPDHRVTVDDPVRGALLSEYARSYEGLITGDLQRHVFNFWEFPNSSGAWEFFQMASNKTEPWTARSHVLRWEQGRGALTRSSGARIQGLEAWGKTGLLITRMRKLSVALYTGHPYDQSAATLIPKDPATAAAIWAFISSKRFEEEVKRLDKKVNITPATLTKVPFDLAHWQDVAARSDTEWMVSASSADPTQWVFSGSPVGAESSLQVAVARLVGYRWPPQVGSSFPACLSVEPDGLEAHADRDGILTLNPVKGEQSAVARLSALLSHAFGRDWSGSKLDNLLASVGFAGRTLDDWLRDGFFEQHCELFHQRPFVWHIWDGCRDGFHALVNYHRLAAPNGEGRRTLEKLLYSYLGDWIDRQRADQNAGVEGADARVAAAEHLKTELTNILAGEPPYDLFVRWKPLAEQPIGWEPDINDGVRINSRPFMTAKPLGARAKGACILRVTPKIKWDKDRGKEPQRPGEDFPWFWGWDPDNKDDQKDFGGRGKEPDGNRWNDLHYTRAFKQAARDKRSKSK